MPNLTIHEARELLSTLADDLLACAHGGYDAEQLAIRFWLMSRRSRSDTIAEIIHVLGRGSVDLSTPLDADVVDPPPKSRPLTPGQARFILGKLTRNGYAKHDDKVDWFRERGVALPSGVMFDDMVEELMELLTRERLEELLTELPNS